MNRLLLLALICSIPAGPGRTTLGVEFLLTTGGRVEGELLNPEQNPRETYLVRTRDGGVVAIASNQVDRADGGSEALDWYRKWLPQMPQTVEGHWQMAEECQRRGLKAQRLFHLEQILKLDPEHKEARYGLGYSNVDGVWVKTDEWNRAQGYVRAGGGWRIPQDVALENIARKNELKTKEWIRQVKTWKSWIEKKRGSERSGIDRIRSIRDPLAAEALVQIVEDEKVLPEIRRLCIDALGGLHTPAGVTAFVTRAVEDPDANVRDACLNELNRFGRLQAARSFEALLKSPDNRKVNRAAHALAILQVPESTLPLIDALVTEHKFQITTGSGPGRTSAGFGSGPGGGGNTFGVGGRPKIITRPLKNERVLDALVAIHPGTNLGYDEEAWKKWYIQQHTPEVVDLRRDH